MNVFFVPCNHPAAKDGVFHCVPSFYEAAHMRDGYEFIIVDTVKFIAQLQQDDPALLEHAERKFKGYTAEQWLQTTSAEFPRDMGHWSYTSGEGLRMSSGQAALVKLVQEIGIPYFPIAVAKANGSGALSELRAKIGYGRNIEASRPVKQSGFRSRGLES